MIAAHASQCTSVTDVSIEEVAGCICDLLHAKQGLCCRTLEGYCPKYFIACCFRTPLMFDYSVLGKNRSPKFCKKNPVACTDQTSTFACFTSHY